MNMTISQEELGQHRYLLKNSEQNEPNTLEQVKKRANSRASLQNNTLSKARSHMSFMRRSNYSKFGNNESNEPMNRSIDKPYLEKNSYRMNNDITEMNDTQKRMPRIKKLREDGQLNANRRQFLKKQAIPYLNIKSKTNEGTPNPTEREQY